MTPRRPHKTIEDNRTSLRHAFGQLGCGSFRVNDKPVGNLAELAQATWMLDLGDLELLCNDMNLIIQDMKNYHDEWQYHPADMDGGCPQIRIFIYAGSGYAPNETAVRWTGE